MMGVRSRLYLGRIGFMTRRLFPAFALVVLASSIAVLAQAPPAKDDKKKTDAQNKEIQNIVKMVDDAVAGQPAPNDLALTWVREDVLKAQGNKEYVPFTVSLDPTKLTSDRVAFYWRVVARNTGTAAAATDESGGKK